MDEERLARMGLCALNHVADPRLAQLIRSHGPEEVWHAVRAQGETTALGRRARTVEPQVLAEETVRCGARFLIPGDEQWPREFAALGDACVGEMGGEPIGVWVTGTVEGHLPGRSVAIVGARAATGYGLHVAEELAAGLADAGWCVISGMAFGIDAAAHRAALAVGGTSAAVMATGIDRTYPTTHERLRRQIEDRGTVWTELPPGQQPVRGTFLARNRIIAALAVGTIVVEAGARSGARNTAAWAGEMCRILMAVPGPVTSSMSMATHHMIRDGSASLVTCVDDVLALLEPLGSVAEPLLRGPAEPLETLPPQLRAVREAMPTRGVAGAEQLSAATGLAVPVVLAAVAELVERGWVVESEGGWSLPRRPG